MLKHNIVFAAIIAPLVGGFGGFLVGCSPKTTEDLKSRVTTINLIVPANFVGGIVLRDGPAKIQPGDSPMSFTVIIQKDGYGFHPYLADIERKEFRIGKAEFEGGVQIKYDVTRDYPASVLLREGKYINGSLSFFIGTEEAWKAWIVDGIATGRTTK